MHGVPMKGAGTVKAYLLVNLSTALWAGNIALGRALRAEIGPWCLTASRAAMASILFAALLALRREGCPKHRPWFLVLVMAGSGVVGFQVLQYAGLRYTTSFNAGLMNATGPLITLALARVLLGQRFGTRHAIGALLSLSGVGVILSGGDALALLRFRFNLGDLLVLAAVSLWGVYSIAGRVAGRRASTPWVAGVSTMLAVPFLVAPAAVECIADPPTIGPGLLLALVYIAAGPSFVAFLAWNEGIRRVGPIGAMAFYNTLPLYAGILGSVFLGEWPGPVQWLGGSLVIGGCLLAASAGTGSPSPGLARPRGLC